MARVSIRYIVDDVDVAIDFYCRELGFREDMHPAPSFAMLSHGDLPPRAHRARRRSLVAHPDLGAEPACHVSG